MRGSENDKGNCWHCNKVEIKMASADFFRQTCKICNYTFPKIASEASIFFKVFFCFARKDEVQTHNTGKNFLKPKKLFLSLCFCVTLLGRRRSFALRSQALPEDSLDRSVSSLQKNSETAKIGLGATKKRISKYGGP